MKMIEPASPVTPPHATKRDLLRQRYLSECARMFDRLNPPEGPPFGETFSAIEKDIEEQSRKHAQLLCEHRLALDPLVSPKQVFPCPKCGRRMRVQEPSQGRGLKATFGEVPMQRPYCVCDPCGFTCAPLDYSLGIPVRGPSVMRGELVCNAATKDRSFDKASATLAHHSKILMSDEGVRKLAESEGRKLFEARARRVEACFRSRGRQPRPPTPPPTCLVITCDGGRVQTRKIENGSRWKESKIGCVYDARPQPDPAAATAEKYKGAAAITQTYVATMEPWEAFGRMLFTEACARGYMNTTIKLFISDAAESIKSQRQEHFSDAHPINDWYHAVEHLADCSKAALPSAPQEADEWLVAHKEFLWTGKVGDIIETITRESHRLGPPPKGVPENDPRLVLHRNVGYFTNNQQAMDYPTYRANGWPIGSGLAESSVKQHSLRVKGSEKFWELPGAEEMLTLCELHFSEDGRWEEYWKTRSTPPADAGVFRTHRAPRPPPQ